MTNHTASVQSASPATCPRCGAATQTEGGLCVSCFLKEGLEGEAEGSAENFAQRLAEDEISDKPRRLGNYEIIRELGRGGMGTVYLARRADAQYEKQVAIKLIKRGMDTDAVLRHFRDERQILAGFDHPGVARLFDAGTSDDGLPYFVMEYVEGLPINEYCLAHRLSINDRLKLFRNVCSAVSYAHRHLVIHRDLKPSNIVVTTDGVPKLLDFGIAKVLQHGTDDQPSITSTGTRLMTPEYASPEQVRGQPVTTASDVYSLGVVVYELLTGISPYRFTSRSPTEIERAITEQSPQRPSTAVARSDGNSKFEIRNSKLLRGDLDNIVLMALRKEPERRYQSAEQFSEDIRRHLEALPVLARKDTVGYRTEKFVRRNRAATAAAALVVVSLLGGIVATTWEAHRARVQEAVAERRFNDVRQLAHSLLFDYHDAIKDLPGATRVREKLVKDALLYLDSLAAEASGDLALQRELAAAYDRIGDVRGQAYSASLGDRAGAMESYLKALRIREALVTANPQDIQSRRELADSNRKIGWQLLDTADASRGVKHLRKAVALYLALTADQPDNAELREALAIAYDRLGLGLEDRGDLSDALDQHRRALALREKLLADDPGNQIYRRELSITDEDMGRALFLSGDTPGAIKINDKALTLRHDLVTNDPTNANHRHILSISYQNDGDYRDQLGDKHGALESFQKNIAINDELLAADPANAAARGNLAYAFQRTGDLLAALENNSQALSNFRKSLQMYEKLAADAPEDLTARLRLAISGAGVGKMYARLGERTLALEECRKAIALLKETTEEPTNAAHRSTKAQAYQYLGEAHAALARSKEIPQAETTQHWTTARFLFEQSLNIYDDMRSRGILGVQDARQLDEATGEIAECDKALRRFQERR
jgi:non-specific serine/threonine protein kinase/serine/threonine-protein kinase